MSTDIQEPESRVQSPRNAWILALRAEVLRVADKDLSAVARVGHWLASYANADCTGAYPSVPTLATLAGCSQDAVTRAIRVLVAVGMLGKRRRPNRSSVYELLMPLGQPAWDSHMHLYSDNRQRRHYAAKKALEAERALAETEAYAEQQVRNLSTDGFRNPSVLGVPEPVRVGGSGASPESPEPVSGRGRNASVDGFRNPSVSGGDHNQALPTVEIPTPDTTWFGPGPQPQVAGAPGCETPDAATEPPAVQQGPSGAGTPRAVPMPPRPAVGPQRSPLLMSVPAGDDLPAAEVPHCSDCGQLLVLLGSGRLIHPAPCVPDTRHHTA